MRIIAGRARGLRLEEPGELPIRPTLDRVREAFFSAVTPRLEGTRFLDLFAGTGANGLEALSRGAASATFADSHPKACALIRRNLAKTGLHANGRVLLLELPGGLARAVDPAGPFDLVYADPPHAFSDYTAVFEGLRAPGLVGADTLLVLEHLPRADVPESAGGWTRTRQRRYGRSMLSFFT